MFAAVNRQVAAFDQGQLQLLLGSDPTVARYRRFIEDVRGAKPSTTSLQSAPLAAVATSWQFALYERLIDATDFGTVAGPAGPVDVRRGWYTIQASADSAARAAAFDKLYAGYAKNRDLLSFALVETVRAQQEVARLAGFRDRPSQAYQGRGLTTDEVRGLIAVVRSRGDIARRFERADAAARRATVGIPPPNLTLDDAAATMVETFGSLGPQLHREAQALLDPTGGRLEIGGGEHARAGGFSFTLRGDVTGVYLDHFGGTPAEVSRLMHESGHAVHRSLFLATAANHLQGPSLSEVVALFGEILLADRLATAAKTPSDSVFWRRQFLAKMLEVFYGANDAELEQAVYDSISAGMSGTADELDRVTRGVDSAYTIERRPVAAGRWMRANLLFEDPLYLSNYLYSGLICVELYWQHQSNPVGFVANYLKFLRDTGDGSPKEIISRDFGLRLDDPSVLASGFKLLDSLVGEFETEVDRGVRR